MAVSYLILVSFIIFILGTVGVFLCNTSKNLIGVLISIELLLVSINLSFLLFSSFFDDFLGQLYILLVLAVAAAESALGLAIIIIFFRLNGRASLSLV